MANYCYNYVRITGDEKTLDLLQEKFKNYSNTNYFTEFGDTFFDIKRDYKSENFAFYYKYGTKWWDFQMQRDEATELIITGDSAWSPPINLIQKISETYNVEIYSEWDEPGMDFAGKVTYINGNMKDLLECSSQLFELEYKTPEEFCEGILENIDEGYEFDDFMEMISSDVIDKIGEKGVEKFKKMFYEYRETSTY